MIQRDEQLSQFGLGNNVTSLVIIVIVNFELKIDSLSNYGRVLATKENRKLKGFC